MAYSTGAVSTVLSPRYGPSAYAPPDPLEAVHILDLLELTGSQIKAGQALALHQSTVCRSVKMLSEQFRLQSQRGARVCRYGSNDSLHYLRLSYRAHRLMEGQLRVATDPLHQSLLSEIGNVQTVPARFRAAEDWAQLVALGLIDGAIVPSYAQGTPEALESPPHWAGLVSVPLGRLALQLVSAARGQPRVLLPKRCQAPQLHQMLEWHGYEVEVQPAACQEGSAWLKRLRDRQLAMPLCLDLLEPGWVGRHGLELLREAPPLGEQLWLLLPEGPVYQSDWAQSWIGRLRSRMAGIACQGRGGLQEKPISRL